MLFSTLLAALSQPLFSLGIALVLGAAVLLTTHRSSTHRNRARHADPAPHSIVARYAPELRSLRVVAVGVIAAFVIELLVSGYGPSLSDVVSWWKYTTPLFAALLGLTAMLFLIAFRGSTPAERPVVPAARRTWLSFGSRADLIGAACALFALAATTIAAGLSSSPDRQGRYVWLEVPVPNTLIDPLRPWFYGWAYGVPVLICLAALTTLTIVTLSHNAARPFVRPQTVRIEQRSRAEVANGIVRIVTAAALLSLAGAWRFIAEAGSGTGLTIAGEGGSDVYDATWQYAEFASAVGWLAPALEIAAFFLLLLVAWRPGALDNSRPGTYAANALATEDGR